MDTFKSKQNGRHFADDIWKSIYIEGHLCYRYILSLVNFQLM